MSFTMDLNSAYVEVVEGSINETVYKTAAKALQAAVTGTPVGNPSLWQNPEGAPEGYTGGHARRNWLVEVDVFTPLEVDGIDSNGTSTISEGTREAKRFDIKRNLILNIHNSVPYINRLNNGWSEQAPAGFVDRAIQAATQ